MTRIMNLKKKITLILETLTRTTITLEPIDKMSCQERSGLSENVMDFELGPPSMGEAPCSKPVYNSFSIWLSTVFLKTGTIFTTSK